MEEGRLFSKVWQPFTSGASFKWVPFERVGEWLTEVIPPVAPAGEANEYREAGGFVEDAWMPVVNVTLEGMTTEVLADSGARYSIIGRGRLRQIAGSEEEARAMCRPFKGPLLRLASGS